MAKTMVSIVVSSFTDRADGLASSSSSKAEQTEERPSTEVVHAPSTEARPATSEASTTRGEEAKPEMHHYRTAGANWQPCYRRTHSYQSEPTVPVASPAATNREAAPQFAPSSEASATSQDLSKYWW